MHIHTFGVSNNTPLLPFPNENPRPPGLGALTAVDPSATISRERGFGLRLYRLLSNILEYWPGPGVGLGSRANF